MQNLFRWTRFGGAGVIGRDNVPSAGIRDRAFFGFAVCVVVLYAIGRSWLLEHSVAKAFNDTPTYDGTNIGWRTECDFDFWTGIRPPVVPLVYRMLRYDHDTIVLFQAVFGAISWAVLALSVGVAFQRRSVGLTAAAFILGLGLTTSISAWDQAMLSESLAYSFQALLLAALFWMIRTWSYSALVAVFTCAFFWVFIRDSHLYYMLFVAVLLAVLGSATRYRWRVWALCVAILALFLVGNHFADASFRWVGNFYNVLTVRILKSPEQLAYLEARGLPVTKELSALKGKLHTEAMHKAPEFESLRTWTFAQGNTAYTQLLLSHPKFLIHPPLEELNKLMGNRRVLGWSFKPEETPSILPKLLEEVFYPVQFGLLVVLMALFWSGGATVAVGRGNMAYVAIIPVTLILLSFPHAMLTWHGDAMEPERHALMPALQLRLGFMIGILLTVDAVMVGRSRAEEAAHSTGLPAS